jgi:hypothetical protein
MSWTNLLKEKFVDAARWVADDLPVITNTARIQLVMAGLDGLEDSMANCVPLSSSATEFTVLPTDPIGGGTKPNNTLQVINKNSRKTSMNINVSLASFLSIFNPLDWHSDPSVTVPFTVFLFFLLRRVRMRCLDRII